MFAYVYIAYFCNNLYYYSILFYILKNQRLKLIFTECFRFLKALYIWNMYVIIEILLNSILFLDKWSDVWNSAMVKIIYYYLLLLKYVIINYLLLFKYVIINYLLLFK